MYYIAVGLFVGTMILAFKLDWLRRIGLSFLVPYLFLVFAVTVFLRSPAETAQIILEPLRDFEHFFTNDFSWFQFRANILLFIPIGFLLPMVIQKPVFMPLLAGLGLSVTIELLQLVLRRGTCETDDLISNSIGLIIGFAAFWLLKALFLAARRIIITIKNKN